MAIENGKPIPGQNILSGTFEKDKYSRVILYPRLTEEQNRGLNNTVSNGTQKDIDAYFNRIFQPLTHYCETIKSENLRVIRPTLSIGIKSAAFIIRGIRGNHARNIPSPEDYTIEKWLEG